MAEQERHPVDDLLRAIAGNVESSAAEREYARQKLDRAIAELGRRQTRRRQRVLVWGMVFAAVFAGVAFVLLAAQPSQARAAIEEIADLVEVIDPLAATDTTFIYTRSSSSALAEVPGVALGGITIEGDSLLYLLNSRRETWYGREGTVQMRTTYLQPTFFSDADRDAYFAAGLDRQDEIGQTRTVTVHLPIEEWPHDSVALDRAIRDRMVTDRGLPETIEYLDVALGIVGESFATPQVRASTLRLIARLEGIQLLGPPSETLTFAVDYVDKGVETRFTITLDRNGYLRHQRVFNVTADDHLGLPPATAIYEAEFAAPIVTGSLD